MNTYTRQQVGSAYRLWEQLSVAMLRSPFGSAYNRRCERLCQRAAIRALYIKLHQRARPNPRLAGPAGLETANSGAVGHTSEGRT